MRNTEGSKLPRRHLQLSSGGASHLCFHHVRETDGWRKRLIHRASPTLGERGQVPSPEVHQDGEDGDLGPVVEDTIQ